MLTSKYMRIISVLGIIALLTLQYVWLRNAYLMMERDMMEKSKECLKEAVEEELFDRCDKAKIGITCQKELNRGDEILSKNKVNQLNEIAIVMQNGMEQMGYHCSINKIKTLFEKKIFVSIGTLPKNSIHIISDSIKNNKFDIIYDNAIFVKLDSKRSIKLILTSPLTSVITKSKYIFIASILLVLLIGVILIFQLKSMIKDKEFTAFMKDYTRILAHEMRTPINDIYMLTSRILSDKTMDTEKIDLYNKEKLNQCSKLLLGIDNILLMAKAEQSKIIIIKSKIDMHQFLNKITEKYKNNYLQRKSLKIETTIKPEDCSAYIDPDLMENVVLNLIENATKYSKEDVSISISCSVEEGRIQLKVKDNGIGISKANQKNIFQQLQRGTNLMSNQIKGFGIGLYYVDKVVKAHQGKVEVISVEGSGSEFIIDIPNRFQ